MKCRCEHCAAHPDCKPMFGVELRVGVGATKAAALREFFSSVAESWDPAWDTQDLDGLRIDIEQDEDGVWHAHCWLSDSAR